ncbi:Rv3654c family TadE-like protein [Rothia sp. LK2588]|uniref:Rv3654c family TadE-like protein n=1 Tax=Rothia sp. LK2588 TaxID=3114369 RepID=UPI0034CF76D3
MSRLLRGESGDHPERGSGTVLALGIVAALCICCVVVAGLIGVVTANQRAVSAADLAALAGADSARGLRSGDPCQAVHEVAAVNGAKVLACSLPPQLEAVVDVRVSYPVRGPAAWLGEAQAVSRAGPPA